VRLCEKALLISPEGNHVCGRPPLISYKSSRVRLCRKALLISPAGQPCLPTLSALLVPPGPYPQARNLQQLRISTCQFKSLSWRADHDRIQIIELIQIQQIIELILIIELASRPRSHTNSRHASLMEVPCMRTYMRTIKGDLIFHCAWPFEQARSFKVWNSNTS